MASKGPSRTTLYREKLRQNDPEKYKEYLEKQRIMSKKRRDEMKLGLKQEKEKGPGETKDATEEI